MKRSIITSTFIFIFTLSYGTVDTTGLIGYWKFDGNTKDETTNGNHGIVNGATLTKDRHGNKDGAYYFDGKDDYISLGKSATLEPTTMTVNAWFRIEDTTKNGAIISCRNSNDGEWGMDMYHHKDFGLITSMGAGASNRAVGHHSFINFDSSEWHMITFVYDGKRDPYRFATYVDCEFIGYDNRTGTSGGLIGTDQIAYHVDSHWIIGAHSQYFNSSVNNGPYYFTGAIDDVAIYNRALSAAEIKTLGGKTSSIQHQMDLPTVSLYPNPTTGEVTIQTKGGHLDGKSTIVLYNNLGQQLMSLPVTSELEKLHLNSFSKGMYIVEIIQPNGVAVIREKLILQ